MTDTVLLKRKIKAQGLTREFLARKLGLSLTSLAYKINGVREFKASEIGVLLQLLRIETMEECLAIFFAEQVDSKGTF